MGEPGRRWKNFERVRKIEERKESKGTRGAGISVVEVEGGDVDIFRPAKDMVRRDPGMSKYFKATY